MYVLAIVGILLLLIFVLYEIYLRSLPSYRAAKYFPGYPVYPVIQNVFTAMFKNQTGTFEQARQWARIFNHRTYRILINGVLCIQIIHHRDVEMLLSSSRLITKSLLYKLIVPFIGDGLLNSTGEKWHQRRKILTPTFHFNILQGFLQTFHEECRKLVTQLDKDSAQGITTKLQPLSTQVTLNTICETAMGIKLDTSESAELYKRNIREVGTFIERRIMNPLLFDDTIYKITGYKAKFDRILRPIHAFTNDIIQQRRSTFRATMQDLDSYPEENRYTNIKQRYAMLDSLLLAEANNQIDAEGIREEVDTFTFEGHDTTGSAFVFIFLLIAHDQLVQQRLFEEVQSMFNNQSNLTVQDYSDLKYMDRVIKESLRIYPPVPFISRLITEDVRYDGKFVPKGTIMNVEIYDLHRDPEQFPDPERFDPDRFLPEQVQRRSPYAYVPFSAGPRNCIGQRFAMLELKAILTAVLREFRVLPVTKREDVVFIADMVLRSRDPIVVKFERR
nr:probable cytochrome P450 4ac1 isoform X1 [Aedes albopictus]